MNKAMVIGQVLFLGLSFRAYSKSGVAEGGFEFMLAIVCFLLMVAGILAGIQYLIKNGRNLFNRFKAILKKKIFIPRNPA